MLNLFKSKTFESITADLAGKVEDLKLLAANKRTEATEHGEAAAQSLSKSNEATRDAERSERVAAKISNLLDGE